MNSETGRFSPREETEIPKTVAYAKGATAQRKGYPISSCEYLESVQPQAAKQWRAGWCDQDMIEISEAEARAALAPEEKL